MPEALEEGGVTGSRCEDLHRPSTDGANRGDGTWTGLAFEVRERWPRVPLIAQTQAITNPTVEQG